MRTSLFNTAFLLILCLAGFYLYSPSLANNFIYLDDTDTITNNEPFFHQGLAQSFIHVFKEPSIVRDRPVTVLSLWLNYKAFGISTLSFRTVNVFLHCLVCFSLFLCCLNLPLSSENSFKPAAVLTAFLFLVHPVNIFAVNCLVLQRSQILASLFGLWALLALFKYAQKNKRKWLYLIPLFLILSVLSKPTGIAFIFILPVFAWLLKIKLPKYFTLDLWAFVAIIIVLTPAIFILHPQKFSMSWLQYWSVSLRAIVVYLQIFFWPFNLRPYFHFDLHPQIFGWGSCLAVIFHTFILCYSLLILRKKNLLLCLAVIGTYLAFLPESIHPLTQVITQYRTYCPYIFLSLFVYALLSTCRKSKIILSIFVCFLLCCAGMAFYRNSTLKILPDLGRERVLSDASDDFYNFETVGVYSYYGKPDDAIHLAQYLEIKRADQKVYQAVRILTESAKRPLSAVEKEGVIDNFQKYNNEGSALPSLLMMADQLIKGSLIDHKNEFEFDLFFPKITAILEDKKYLNHYRRLYVKVFSAILPEDGSRYLQAQSTLEKLRRPPSL